MPLGLIACAAAWVVDGDSLRCGYADGRHKSGVIAGAFVGEVRLLGIDAPDYRDSPPCAGHYGDHVCDDEGAKAARLELIKVVAPRRSAVKLEGVGRDRYGRLLAVAWAGAGTVGGDGRGNEKPINLNCWQLQRGAARYIVAYDNGRRIARDCGR